VEEAQRLLPEARIIRWDRDVTAKKNAHENIAAMFGRHEADVLVGTQMIAKGLDFPLVTLVGVILADVGLHVPDFRASERAFQLMTQVAGRAGRADLPSRVVVQTYSPDHYALHAARDHDYWQFYRQEMMFRLRSGYPPFSRLARFVIRDRSSVKAANRARSLTSLLQERIEETGSDVELIGPAPAFVARVNDMHQWHLIAKGSELRPILEVVPDEIVVDVDPIDLL
jgi:primosomal protein N' (replication factor Y)